MADSPGNEIQRLQTLLETVRLLNSTLELKELTGIILEVVRAEIAVERISVFVVDRSRNRLQALVAQEMDSDEFSLPVGMGIAGTVAATGEVLDIPDAYADPRFDRRFDGKFGYYTNDLFALPVCNRSGEIVGVLELLNRLRPISPSDREFLLGISVYIGLALENAFLHAQVRAGEPLDPARGPETIPVQTIRREIPDPLTFAMGYLELAPDPRDLPSSGWLHLENVRRGITETAGAALKFQEFMEQERQALAPINLSDELRRLSELRAEEWARQNIQATLVVEAAPLVYANVYEMRLVLSFLIRNAEAAILQSDSNRHLRIHSWCTGKKAHVSIHHKVAAGNLGTTLGYAIANSIVQQYKGQIRFDSAPDKGTTFLIELPAHRESRVSE